MIPHARTRGHGLPFLLSLAVIGLAGPAIAQPIAGTPYVFSSAAWTYQPLQNPNVLFTSGRVGNVDLQLPFSFRYYDSSEDTLTVSMHGVVAVGGGHNISITNQVPGSSTQHGWIGPFWDYLEVFPANGSLVGYEIQGTAPARVLVIEWRNMSPAASSASLISFQMRIHEGLSGRIDIDYGPTSGTATYSGSMAMEDQAGGRPIRFHSSNCTTSCTRTNLASLSNMRLTYVQDPGVELVALGLNAPEFASLGAPLSIPIALANLHGVSIGPFDVQVIASESEQLTNPRVVGATQLTMAAFQTSFTQIQVTLPANLGEGRRWLALVIDSSNQVTEVDESNNRFLAPNPVRALSPKPDLVVSSVRLGSRQVTAGGQIPVYAQVSNQGGIAASATTFSVVLSTNPVVSGDDAELARFNVDLTPGQTRTSTTMVTIPAATNSGAYTIGVVADPEGRVDETNESNNGRAALATLEVAGGNLAVLSTALPRGYLRVSYVAFLAATGGDGNYDWRVVAGMPPAGLGLARNGQLFGRPSRAETVQFTVEVTSAGVTARRQLTLTISDPAEPLTIVTRQIPPGAVGQEYGFGLVATGGPMNAEVTWSATGLPNGLSLSPEGLLGGTPTAVSENNLTITAAAGGQTATRNLALVVRENATLQITLEPLPVATFGEPYQYELTATGAQGALTWILEAGRLPDGMDLATSGEISGTPTQVGRFAFSIQVREAGAAAARDVAAFEIVVSDTEGFNIVTESLPGAFKEEGYDESVAALGGRPPYQWRIVEGRLPDGLVSSVNPVSNEFRIAGAPSVVGDYNLLVEALDTQGRTARRALAVRVVERPAAPVVTDEGGCSSTGDANALGLLLLLGLVPFRRRH